MDTFEPPVRAPGAAPLPSRDRQITLRLTTATLDRVDALAAESGHTRSDTIRILLARGLDALAETR